MCLRIFLLTYFFNDHVTWYKILSSRSFSFSALETEFYHLFLHPLLLLISLTTSSRGNSCSSLGAQRIQGTLVPSTRLGCHYDPCHELTRPKLCSRTNPSTGVKCLFWLQVTTVLIWVLGMFKFKLVEASSKGRNRWAEPADMMPGSSMYVHIQLTEARLVRTCQQRWSHN